MSSNYYGCSTAKGNSKLFILPFCILLLHSNFGTSLEK